MTWEEMADELDRILAKHQLSMFMPIGWTETDFERVADAVEPMRRDIERLRERALQQAEATDQRPGEKIIESTRELASRSR
ncbi:MAG TPA: hypothetical protein VFW23_12515 [Tepidisphaeraceae bacterium]|nr:hypothetical protein [Tepidisphaeraceae bacterium]